MSERADVAVIGAGVVGCAVARELTRYRLDVTVLEAGHDVALGATRANSGIIHAGFDAAPGSRKAALNVRGAALYPRLAAELDFPYHRNGSLVLAFRDQDRAGLEALRRRGETNGVAELRLVDRDELTRLEPGVGPDAVAALYAPGGAIAGPYECAIALAENAAANGAVFLFGRRVSGVEREGGGGYRLRGEGWDVAVRAVVNAAGIHADDVNNLASAVAYRITPRAGQYCLLDKECGEVARHTVFQLPGPLGKGVLVTPTTHGNLLVGPNAVDIADKEDVSTHAHWQEALLASATRSVPGINPRAIITAFTGLRAHGEAGDFVVGEAPDAPGFYNALGIESPGLSAAPAIAEELAGLVAGRLGAARNDGFAARRTAIAAGVGDGERGRVMCRCETVTEAAVREAIRRVPGARDADGVKRRVRAGMGRCQGGFCLPRVAAILAEELGVRLDEVTKAGPGTEILAGGELWGGGEGVSTEN